MRARGMDRGRTLRVAAGIGVLALVTGASAASAGEAGVTDATSHATSWFSIGVMSGTTRLDGGLADFQWDVTPRMDWGAQALAGRGRFAAGVRLWRAQTSQQIDPGDPAAAAAVRATSTELVGHARLASPAGCDVMAVGSTGLLHLGYHPAQVNITPPGGGGPIAVELAPIDAWIGGAGLAMRRTLHGPWAAGVELDRRFFALDTAHRNGSAIEYERRTFGDWSARLELAWVHGRP